MFKNTDRAKIETVVMRSLLKNGVFANKDTAKEELEILEQEYLETIQESIHGAPYDLSMKVIILEKNIELIKKFLGNDEKEVKTHKRKRSV